MKRIALMLPLLAAMCAVPVAAQTSGGYRQLGAANMAAGQVAVGTTATLVAAQRDTRNEVVVAVGAANACTVGGPGVTLTTGFAIQPVAGASVPIRSRAAIYMVCSAATTVSVLDAF